jgi:glycerophosphoryl diester phosphodiesterase
MPENAILQTMYTGETLVFGHRGARAYAPANTLPAFELAAQQGAHGIELDVQLSADGCPVVIHDFTVDATTDGSGRVADLTLAQLKTLDAGSYFNAAFAGIRIPTLDEVFAAVGTRLFINVEIKSVDTETDGIEAAVAHCISRHGMQQRVIVSSFNPLTLRRFQELLPQIPLGFLYDHTALPVVPDLIAGLTYEACHPQHMLIDAALVAAEHQAGRVINTWTVNDAQRARELRRLGVDGIITDTPDLILSALRQPD